MDKVAQEQQSLKGSLNITRQIIKEIKMHVMEGGLPVAGLGQLENPMAPHRLLNIKNDVEDINRELEEILKAVSIL